MSQSTKGNDVVTKVGDPKARRTDGRNNNSKNGIFCDNNPEVCAVNDLGGKEMTSEDTCAVESSEICAESERFCTRMRIGREIQHQNNQTSFYTMT